MTKKEFVKAVNDLRRESGGRGYQWSGFVDGTRVRLRGYGTHIQRLETTTSFKGKKYPIVVSNPYDQLVRDFKKWLAELQIAEGADFNG